MNTTDTDKIVLSNLKTYEYEHAGEKDLQKSLNNNAVVQKLFSLITEYGVERWYMLQHLASSIEVKPTNLPELDKIKTEICEILDVNIPPRMYIEQDPQINAFALGINNPMVVLTTGTLEKLSKEELYFIIGHEMGHIKSQHQKYYFLHKVLPVLGSLIPLAGPLISSGIELLLYRFDRIAEFTSDRAGLLSCQNLDTATHVLMKLSGYPEEYYNTMNKDDYIKQFEDFKDFNYTVVNKVVNLLSSMYSTHPWSVLRGKELYEWVDNKNYDNVINRTSGNMAPTAVPDENLTENISFCSKCGNKAVEGAFCPYCGQKYSGEKK